MTIVNAIKYMMKKEGITQQMMAERLGMKSASEISGRFASKNLNIRTILMFVTAVEGWELVLRKVNSTDETRITME